MSKYDTDRKKDIDINKMFLLQQEEHLPLRALSERFGLSYRRTKAIMSNYKKELKQHVEDTNKSE